jgi:diguanylate cyclase (GGDEF)-like protein/PAS domain S-box-containing protein
VAGDRSDQLAIGLGDLPIGAVVVADGQIVAANDEAGRLIGRAADEVVGLQLDGFVAEVNAGTGRVEPLAGPRTQAGEQLVVLRDCTEERRLSAVVDAVADSTLIIDRDGLVAWQSERLSSRVPAGPQAGLGVNPIERIHPEDLPYTLETLGKGLADPEFFTRYNIRSRAPDDDDVWEVIEVTGVSRIDDPDVDGIVVQVRNLDDGEELASVGQSQGQFQSLAEAAPIGIVVLDVRGRTVFRNSAAIDLLGQRPDLHSGIDWLEGARGDHRAELDEMVADALRGNERSTTAEFEPTTARRVWLRVNVVPQRGSAGDAGDSLAVVGAIVTLEDVTAEFEARQATERLTHMLDATEDYVAVWRPSGELLYVNTATREALKRLREGGARGHLTDLIDEEPGRIFAAETRRALDRGDMWRGELPLNIAPGRTIPVSAIGVVRRDDAGEIDWIAMHARDISDLKEAEARLRQLATRDGLTGLANRSLFNDRLEQSAARHARSGDGLAVLFCDLDGFKPVNDEHGHAVGDEVLVAVARRLEHVTRAADTVARVGGDEFVIICEGLAGDEELGELCDRIIASVSAPVVVGTVNVRVGISIGIGVVTDAHMVDPDRLLSAADSAMYRAKARGGNGYRIVDVGASGMS